jgi:hypothetical protein
LVDLFPHRAAMLARHAGKFGRVDCLDFHQMNPPCPSVEGAPAGVGVHPPGLAAATMWGVMGAVCDREGAATQYRKRPQLPAHQGGDHAGKHIDSGMYAPVHRS